MASRIEDYALIGDCHSVALVGKDGAIDWLCFPRFDSDACFAALLGTPDNGRWLLAPVSTVRSVRRRYYQDTLILETEFTTDAGTVAVIDFMPVRDRTPDLVRIVEGRRGQVPMRLELVIRFGYGEVVPWVQRTEDGVQAVAGPDALRLRTPVRTRGHNLTTVAEFTAAAGQRAPFSLSWHPSYQEAPPAIDPEAALKETQQRWEHWSGRCTYHGPWREQVLRSLITLKALTYRPTGGIVAAATTSLPEHLGGVRNWDYRFCWLRDATFTLLALLNAGYTNEARAWQQWLLRAVAGDPTKIQIMYGLAGERRLTEYEIPWLAGYEKSRPVRVGNAAHAQFQLDVYGEVLDALYHAAKAGLKPEADGWNLQRALADFVADHWDDPDEGIWEVRGPRQHFTHSKVMAWVALDRAIKSAEGCQLEAPLDRWRQARKAVHEKTCQQGFNPRLNAFVQSYGSDLLDASLLMLPLVGFLPADDPRVRGTVEAIARDLRRDGLVARYDTAHTKDGLPPGEGAFLACTFWLADNYALHGRTDEAKALLEELLGYCNDVGLLAEEYDQEARRQVGNFPQAFSHVGLINTAMNLSRSDCPARQRKHA